jgi:hypothetical protein
MLKQDSISAKSTHSINQRPCHQFSELSATNGIASNSPESHGEFFDIDKSSLLCYIFRHIETKIFKDFVALTGEQYRNQSLFKGLPL